jgi:hypothetical protein
VDDRVDLNSETWSNIEFINAPLKPIQMTDAPIERHVRYGNMTAA